MTRSCWTQRRYPSIGLPEVASATPVQVVGTGTPTCGCSRPITAYDFTVVEVAPRDLPT